MEWIFGKNGDATEQIFGKNWDSMEQIFGKTTIQWIFKAPQVFTNEVFHNKIFPPSSSQIPKFFQSSDLFPGLG